MNNIFSDNIHILYLSCYVKSRNTTVNWSKRRRNKRRSYLFSLYPPLASTFMDEETMDGCIIKAVEWCVDLSSHDATHVTKISMSEIIGVTRKDYVWCSAGDLMVVAEVLCGINSAYIFIRTVYPC